MSDYDSILSAAAQLPIGDRLRLIDDLASSVPDDEPPTLSDEWLQEISRRSGELDAGKTQTEPWIDVRKRLFDKHGIPGVDRAD